MSKFHRFAKIIFITIILVIFATKEPVHVLLRRGNGFFSHSNKLMSTTTDRPKIEWNNGKKMVMMMIAITTRYENSSRTFSESSTKRLVLDKHNLKYILQWSDPERDPFNLMGKGQDRFLAKGCPVNNCFIANVPLSDVTEYDAILFHGPEINQNNVSVPPARLPYQKYIFVSRESPTYYPIKTHIYDGIFNWTYTYKLNSDIYFGFISIRNKEGEVIGPKRDMHWLDIKDMKDIDSDFKSKLKSKRLAAAWFVSNCYSMNLREKVALLLQKELAKYNLVLDIYSDHCKWKKIKSCPKDKRKNRSGMECLRKIETDYYFYLSFENSHSDDYVTEKLLNAVQHYAVPVVYGGANYTRFLPDGSYLDAKELGIRNLALAMIHAITHKEVYYEFFKWTNHYSYHDLEDTPASDYMCALCRAINDDHFVKQIRVYRNMRGWWKSYSRYKL